MRNNHHMKMIAWVMAIIMVLCAMPGAMAATGILPGVDYVDDDFAITKDNAFVKESYKTMDDSEVDNISNADRSQTYKLVLQVEEDANTVPFPEEGYYMIYTLPSVVESAESNPEGNGTVRWSYEASSHTVEFTWAEQKTNKFTAEITVKLANVFDLYNMAVLKINNKEMWYRLNKTYIQTNKPATAYNYKNQPFVTDYSIQPYDFHTTKVVVDGKEYVYFDSIEEYAKDPKPYYTVELYECRVAETIGGLVNRNDKNSEIRWLLPEGVKKYDDPNNTIGFHINYRITLFESMEEQPLYNFLKGKDNKYYRLKKTTIIAPPAKSIGSGKPVTISYKPEGEYDFSNLVLTFNNKEYRYSATKKEGKYENYYTITLSDFIAKDRFHSDANWFKNEKGWIDGAKETYTEAELANNNTFGIHQDYIANFYDGNTVFYGVDMYDGEEKIASGRYEQGTIPELTIPTKEGFTFAGWETEDGNDYDTTTPLAANIKLIAQWESNDEIEQSVTITSNWPEGKPAFIGTKITLTAHPVGFVEGHYHVQWERSTDMVNWEEIEGANEINYVYVLDKDTVKYSWRVVVTDTE